MEQINQERVLYQDKDVRITNFHLVIKWYYFPLGLSKTIALKDIKRVEKRELGWAKARLWGMDATQWGYWLPGDKNRFSRKQFIGVHLQGASIKPSFTTENIDQVHKLLRELVQGDRGKQQNSHISLELQQKQKKKQQSSEQTDPLKKQ